MKKINNKRKIKGVSIPSAFLNNLKYSFLMMNKSDKLSLDYDEMRILINTIKKLGY